MEKLINYTPFLFFFSSIFLLYDKKTLNLFFIIGFFINILINIILKGIIQEPRPNENYRLFYLDLLNIKRSENKGLMSYDRYGMPSGHAQTAFYSTIFIYFALKNISVTIFYIFLSIITIYQRVMYNYHTIQQVIVGSIIGIIIGYIFEKYGKTMIR